MPDSGCERIRIAYQDPVAASGVFVFPRLLRTGDVIELLCPPRVAFERRTPCDEIRAVIAAVLGYPQSFVVCSERSRKGCRAGGLSSDNGNPDRIPRPYRRLHVVPIAQRLSPHECAADGEYLSLWIDTDMTG